LINRSYGGGEIRIHEVLADTSAFTRYLFSYPSDGLEIYGFLNVPKGGEPPYPVVIALHGYIEPTIYATLDYTTGYADALARAGFLVLHPNLRGYPPSDEGENLFRVGMAVDVLNLAALVREWGGREGPLELADPQALGLWGHSMGGGVATRVITVDPEIRAAVLYGAMSGDDQKNFERIFYNFSNGTRGIEELSAPPEAFQRISPVYFLDRIQAAVSIHHGDEDGEVPLAWSEDLCARLQALEKPVECFTYEDQPHTFYGEGNDLFIQRMIDFFQRQLKP
jgi:dipeptidyl aminopeptidase/acylaminoacyl peptidase